MKTVKEWLEELPEPYRTQALENAQNPAYAQSYLAKDHSSLSSAINWAFVWKRTPQGHEYWQNIHTEAEYNNGRVKASTPASETPATPARKPFNLEAAKAGKPAVFGNGTPVHRFLAFDLKMSGYPILATYLDNNGQEVPVNLTEKAEFNLHGSCDGGQLDVFMVPEKVTRWINVYQKDGSLISGVSLHGNEKRAKHMAQLSKGKYIGAFPVEITL